MGRPAKQFRPFHAARLAVLCAALAGPAAAKPHRIVSTNVCADQLVLLLADPQNIASVSRLAREAEVSNYPDRARAFPANNARAEEIIRLSPDLVMGDVQTGKQANRLAKSIGVPVHIVDWPASIADVGTIILAAGHAVGEDRRATQVVAQMSARIAAARTLPDPGLTALVYEPNGMTTGPGTLSDDVLRMAGLRNLAAGLTGASYGTVSLERVITAVPDLLILDDSYIRSSSRAQQLLHHPAFVALRGRTRLFSMSSRLWLCPGPWVAQAVESLAMQTRAPGTSLAPR